MALEFLIATIIVVAIMVLDTAIVHAEAATTTASCWLSQALLMTGTAAASIGCCLGVVTFGLFTSGGGHDR